MTFNEAFKVGRGMRRKSRGDYMLYCNVTQLFAGDAAADDWEVEPCLLTLKDFYDAYCCAVDEYSPGGPSDALTNVVECMAERLGLK